jgi:hypothetical protein
MREPWKPGQSGNPKGRPPGSRNKLGDAFVEALYKDFAEHGAKAIERCRETKPEVYLMVICKVMPKELNVKTDGHEAFVRIWNAISRGLRQNDLARDDEDRDLGEPGVH